MALPREGHLEAVFHTFSYLKKRHNPRMVFDPTCPNMDLSNFQEHDWKHFYGCVQEPVPQDAAEPHGREVNLPARCSRTGFSIYLNAAPTAWLLKKQAMIKTSVFGAELVAVKQVMERLRSLRYKLCMMGVLLSGPSYINQRGQHVSDSQYAASRVNIEEEVELYLLLML